MGALYVGEELTDDARDLLIRDAMARERAQSRIAALEMRFADGAQAVVDTGAPPKWVARAVRATCCGGHAFSAVASELGWRGVLETQCDISAVEALVDDLVCEADEERHTDAFYGEHVVDLASRDVCDVFAALGLWVYSVWTRAVSPQLRADIVVATENSVNRVACLRAALSRIGAAQFSVLATIVSRMTSRALAGLASTGSLTRRAHSSSGAWSTASNSFVQSPLLVNMFDRAMTINAAVFGPLLFAHSDDELDTDTSDQQTPSSHASQHGVLTHASAVAGEEQEKEDEEAEEAGELEDVVDVIRAENAFCVLINLWPDVSDIGDQLRHNQQQQHQEQRQQQQQQQQHQQQQQRHLSDDDSRGSASSSRLEQTAMTASFEERTANEHVASARVLEHTADQTEAAATRVAGIELFRDSAEATQASAVATVSSEGRVEGDSSRKTSLDEIQGLRNEVTSLRREIASLREHQASSMSEVSEICAFWIEMVLSEVQQSAATSQNAWLAVQRRIAQVEKSIPSLAMTTSGSSIVSHAHGHQPEQQEHVSVLVEAKSIAESGSAAKAEGSVGSGQRGGFEGATPGGNVEQYAYKDDADDLCRMFTEHVSAKALESSHAAQVSTRGSRETSFQSSSTSVTKSTSTYSNVNAPRRYFRDGKWVLEAPESAWQRPSHKH